MQILTTKNLHGIEFQRTDSKWNLERSQERATSLAFASQGTTSCPSNTIQFKRPFQETPSENCQWSTDSLETWKMSTIKFRGIFSHYPVFYSAVVVTFSWSGGGLVRRKDGVSGFLLVNTLSTAEAIWRRNSMHQTANKVWFTARHTGHFTLEEKWGIKKLGENASGGRTQKGVLGGGGGRESTGAKL